MRIVHVEDYETALEVMNEASRFIVGFSPPPIDWHRRLAEHHDSLFAGYGVPPTAGQLLVAVDGDGRRHGAALVDAVNTRDRFELTKTEARAWAQHHRVLSALYVLPSARGSRIGSHLLEQAAQTAVEDGARYLDGFVDDANGSARFYARAGARVTAHNRGISRREPSGVTLHHDPRVSGHWFYIDGDAQLQPTGSK